MAYYIIIALLIVLAGRFKASADLQRNRRDQSVFALRDSPGWWKRYVRKKIAVLGLSEYEHSYYEARLPNRYKPHALTCPIDGWHMANAMQDACWCAAIGLVPFVPPLVPLWLHAICLCFGAFLLRMWSFNLHYRRIFILKKYRK